jgi:hypothetical protein
MRREWVNSQRRRDFPHPGLAHDGDRLPVAHGGAFERLGELLLLTVAPDKAGQAAGGAGLEPGPGRHDPDQLVDRRRGLEPLHGDGPQGFDLDVALGQLQGLAGDEDGARSGDLLHAGGEMGRLPDGGVVHVEVAADGPHYHLAGIEPRANLHRSAARALHLVRVQGHPSLHPQGGVAGAHGMVLVRDRRPEQRHDPVAHDLIHRALVAVDGLHHPFQDGVEKLPGLLRIAVGQQLHRALEVGEQHRDLLALAFQGTLGGEDLLGEVLGSVGLRGAEPRGGGRLDRRQPLTALAAELCAGPIRLTATWAGRFEASPTLVAERRVGRVLVLAPGTLHHDLGCAKASLRGGTRQARLGGVERPPHPPRSWVQAERHPPLTPRNHTPRGVSSVLSLGEPAEWSGGDGTAGTGGGSRIRRSIAGKGARTR